MQASQRASLLARSETGGVRGMLGRIQPGEHHADGDGVAAGVPHSQSCRPPLACPPKLCWWRSPATPPPADGNKPGWGLARPSFQLKSGSGHCDSTLWTHGPPAAHWLQSGCCFLLSLEAANAIPVSPSFPPQPTKLDTKLAISARWLCSVSQLLADPGCKVVSWRNEGAIRQNWVNFSTPGAPPLSYVST